MKLTLYDINYKVSSNLDFVMNGSLFKGMKKLQLIIKYISALSNLYGLFPKEKLLFIFNKQNDEKIDLSLIEKIMHEKQEHLQNYFVYVDNDYFVHETIYIFDDIELEKTKKIGKPYYIPGKDKLLKFADPYYLEENIQFERLRKFIAKERLYTEKITPFEMTADIVVSIQTKEENENLIQSLLDNFSRVNIAFKDEAQLNQLVELIVDLANHTRVWENNGHTPDELEQMTKEKETETSRKVGRNEQCPCGSGRKYKRCCI